MAIRVGLAARAGLKDSQLNGQIQIADVAAPADSDGGLSRCVVTVTRHTGRRTVAGIDAESLHNLNPLARRADSGHEVLKPAGLLLLKNH